MSHRLRGFLQSTSLLAGILFGLVLFLFKGGMSFGLVSQASWFALPSHFLGVWPKFSLPAILAIVCTYLAVTANSLGASRASPKWSEQKVWKIGFIAALP